MFLSVPFLIIPSAPTITRAVVVSKLFFWMMEIFIDRTFFAFIGRGGLVTWQELTLFLMLKRKIGNLGSFERRLWWEWTAAKRALCLTAENHVVWRNFPLNYNIYNGWLRAWWSSNRYPVSIAESSSRKEIFLIADLKKFYQVSNSIAESYSKGDIAMLWTQKLWMLNTRLVGIFSFKTLHKGTFL